ncbi:MAG TPA: hypothetical protein VH413_04455 [Verrucomicrobiae bacterium]|jgi:hypothetical protein|nr:hypothetical protein [Verrucomicrobiae bacterium]
MNSTSPASFKRRRTRVVLVSLVALIVLAAAVLELGCMFECEYPFWPSLWLAKQTRTPDGSRVTDLIRVRSGSSYVSQYWHHCTWCDVVYPHAPHMAVKVTINDDENDFLLFDWQMSQRKLLPITVHTAKLFPELSPSGYTVKPLGVGLNPQLYHNDEPCLIVAPLGGVQVNVH